jgi:hypothetical protein
MARRKNLTALAALGTLGYMLSKKGDKKDEKSTTAAAERRITADREATDQKTSGDKEDMFIEPNYLALLRLVKLPLPRLKNLLNHHLLSHHLAQQETLLQVKVKQLETL